MSYILGATTLPTPKEFYREQIETGASVMTINGTTKKDIINRKEKYVLVFEMLTQAQVGNITSEYNDQTTKNFSVSESNLTISATPVHIEMVRREYNTRGNEYREDVTLFLTEVS